MNLEILEQQLSELPLYVYAHIDPKSLEFTPRVRWICENECPMYGQSWACPPGTGEVAVCERVCKGYDHCLLISTIQEVSDIADIRETLATRPAHEEVTNRVAQLLRGQGATPYVLSTEACSICERCAYLDGAPCHFPEKMHPCVESHGINIVPTLENVGIEFQFGENVVTWVSLLFY